MAKKQELTPQQKIGNILKDMRIKSGLGLTEYANRIGIDKSRVIRIERGSNITIETLTKVLDFFGAKLSIIESNCKHVI